MNYKFKFFINILFLLLLTACGPKDIQVALDSGAIELSGFELKKLLTGSTVNIKGPGFQADLDYKESGKLTGSNSYGEKDQGVWQIKDNTLCITFKTWGNRDKKCYHITREDESFKQFNTKGMLRFTFTITSQGTFTENISTKNATSSSPTQKSTTRNSSLNSNDLSSYQMPTITPQTIKDVNYFVRSNAKDCPGCNLANAELAGLNLIGANLEGANLTQADLSFANLRRANMKGANLYKANLQNAILTGADLTGANFTASQISGANVKGSIGFIPPNK